MMPHPITNENGYRICCMVLCVDVAAPTSPQPPEQMAPWYLAHAALIVCGRVGGAGAFIPYSAVVAADLKVVQI